MKCAMSRNRGFIEIYYEDLQPNIQKLIMLLYDEEELEKIKKVPLYKFEK